MKTLILAGAAALALVGCASLADRTGLTAEQQLCVAGVAQMPDMTAKERAAKAMADCGVSLDALAAYMLAEEAE